MIRVMIEIKSGNNYHNLNTIPIANTNCNYGITYKQITRAETVHMSSKLVKFNRYKHTSTWLTRGLLTSTRYRDEMKKQLT